MLGGVVTNQMPFVFHPSNQLGIPTDEIFQNKECAFGVMRFQRIENARDVSVFISRVKGEINNLFIGIFSYKKAVFFFDIRHGRVNAGTKMFFFPFAIPVLCVVGVQCVIVDKHDRARKQNDGKAFYRFFDHIRKILSYDFR